QVAFLHRVLGIGRIAHEIAGERIDGVEMRQGEVAKSPRPVRIAVLLPAHLACHRTPGLLDGEPVSILAGHHGDGFGAPPAPASTTMVAFMCGCNEQKYS